MERIKYDFILKAMQPIAHHAGTEGNMAFLMREDIRQPDGCFVKVPIITGDTMRHGMREAATYYCLDAAGILNDHNISSVLIPPLATEEKSWFVGLTEAALRLLFAGGMIKGASGGAVKISEYQEMINVFPPIRLFGGCSQNRMIPGMLIVNRALLICEETRGIVPGWAWQWADSEEGHHQKISSCRSHVEEHIRVKMDPTLDPQKQMLLSSHAREAVSERLLTSEAAGEAGDSIAKDREKSSMMPRSYEVIKTGSLFYWSVTAICFSELDVDVFHTALFSFLANAYVGGQSRTGNGHIIPIKAGKITFPRPVQALEPVDVQALGSTVGSLFSAHMADKGESLKQFLATVKA